MNYLIPLQSNSAECNLQQTLERNCFDGERRFTETALEKIIDMSGDEVGDVLPSSVQAFTKEIYAEIPEVAHLQARGNEIVFALKDCLVNRVLGICVVKDCIGKEEMTAWIDKIASKTSEAK